MTHPPGVASPGELRSLGFEGFVTVSELRADARGVPAEPGAWIVVRESAAVPHFLPRSAGAAWRGEDPTLPADALAARWVPHACLLYAGAAPGPGVRHRLQQRIKRFLRFGDGRHVAAADGRAIWQLAGTGMLRIAWRRAAAGEPARVAAAEVLRAFAVQHGARPFGNEPGEDEA